MERHEAIASIVAKFFKENRDMNPYASADTMRSLDHVIRTGLADGLARAAAAWRTVYQQLSRDVGIPTRDHPFPDQAEISRMRQYKQLADTLSEWASRIQALEAPSNDRVYHRIRNNDQLLELLIDTDYRLASIAESMDRLADTLRLTNAEELRVEFLSQLEALGNAIRERSRTITAVP